MADDSQMSSPANRSMLRDFVASIATMRGDLSNITAPPFVLDTKSTVELPSFWSQNPSIFCAPAQSDDPAERALLVLKWFLSSLRSQNYMGHSEDESLKKPLNAFLGEVFLARWDDKMGTTRLVSEQVSHHPPITACKVWNDEHGVSASGYTRQTITFNGAVSIKQTGHAIFTLSKQNESYLIPLPELRVRGILSGSLYPELTGKYYLPSTSGYMSAIDFSGKGWFGTGSKHSFEASIYKEEDGEDHPIYTIKGTWHREFVIHDVRKGEDVEVFDIVAEVQKTTKLIVEPLDEQDPWESRRAWKDVISALNRGDMKGTVEAKSKLEQGQRAMRKAEQATGDKFQMRFFGNIDNDPTTEKLVRKLPGSTTLEIEQKDTKGIWAFDMAKWQQGIEKPYHGETFPDNSHAIYNTDLSTTGEKRSSTDSITSAASLSSNSNASISRPVSRTSTESPPPRRSLDTFNLQQRRRDLQQDEIQPRRSLDTYHQQQQPQPQRQQEYLQQQSQPRRSLDTFRLPFRNSTPPPPSSTSPHNSTSRKSLDFSSTISHLHLRHGSTSSQTQQKRRDSTSSTTSTKSISESILHPNPTNNINGENSSQSKQRSASVASIDMNIAEQIAVENMLRDRYSSASSTAKKAKRKSRLGSVSMTSTGMDAGITTAAEP